MKDLRKLFYNHLSEEEFNQVIKESKQKHEEMLNRKNNSNFICRIPDWTGQGGMVEFWINSDNTFESEDVFGFESLESAKQSALEYFKNYKERE
jgi:hypothetical protein